MFHLDVEDENNNI